MKTRMNLIWLITLMLCASIVVAAQDNKKNEAKANPIKKSELIKALESNAISSKELTKRINQRGVDFELSEKIEQELKNAGASSEIIAAVNSSYTAQQKKKGLFGKMKDGVGNAGGKTKEAAGKAKEVAGKVPLATIAPLFLPPPLAVGVVVAQQIKKNKDAKAKAKTADTEKTIETVPAISQNEKKESKKGADETAAAKKPKNNEAAISPKPAGDLQKTPLMVGGLPTLTGTAWKIDFGKGVTKTVFQFCKNRKWEIVPARAAAIGAAGKSYSVSGDTLTSVNADDHNVEKWKMTWKSGVLELFDGKTTLRLHYNGETECR